MNFKGLLKENKIYIISLIGYTVFQLSSLIIKSPFILFMYFSLFGVSIGSGITNINRNYKLYNSLNTLWINIFLAFIINLILTLIYIPTLVLPILKHYNGKNEMDPMMLLAAFPTVFFIIISITFIIASILIKIFSNKNQKISKVSNITSNKHRKNKKKK